MASTVQVKLNLEKFKIKPESINDVETQTKVGNKIIEMMKELISKGISPIKGYGRFIGYATQRNADKKAYPRDNRTKKDYPNKQVRPVNLFLSGDMLGALKWMPYKFGVIVGVFDNEQKEKAKGHQKGTNRLPQRKFLPTTKGESLNISIMREIKSIYIDKIKRIIKGSSK